MKTLRPSALQVIWRVVCCVLVLQIACFDETRAQTPTSQALGSLRTTGEVYLNGVRAGAEQSLFPGEAVRTESDGAAALTLPGFALLTIAPQSEVSFRAAPNFATLQRGSLEVRSLQVGRALGIQFGNLMMSLSSLDSESAGIVTLGADGSARVECRLGSVGVGPVGGPALLVLRPNQSVGINVDGTLQKVAVGSAPEAQTSTQSAPAAKSSHAGYLILAGVAAGGGAATAIVLLSRKSGNPVSASSP